MKRMLALLLLSISACQSEIPGVTLLPAEDQLRADVYWLADDARDGRLPGTPGAEQAANYIETRFETLGLEPLASLRNYRQTFTLPGRTAIGPRTALRAGGKPAILAADYRPLAFSMNGAFSGPVAFAGYGVVSKKYAYDDYAGIDVTDRVVVAMRYEPHDASGKSRFTNGAFTGDAAITAKARAAQARGAKALLLVNPPLHHADDAPLRPFIAQGAHTAESSIPVLSITPDFAETLLAGRSIAELQEQIDRDGKPALLLVDDVTVSGEVDLQVTPISTDNVVAMLPGIGPTKDEFVLIGAHYDHIGRGQLSSRGRGSDAIHNGADDNASGIAVMLAAARRLANHRLNRSVVFVAFSGEESGLIGSDYFVDHPPVPVEKITAMINLDMVGRLRKNTLFVGGDGTRAAFSKILAAADQASPIELMSIGKGGYGPSDQQSFAMKKVPVLFFFTGLHDEYHRPEDDAPLINYSGLGEVADIVTGVIARLSDEASEPYVGAYDSRPINAQINPSATTRPTTRPATTRATTQKLNQ
ncbi:MAG: M20/M25/M40 family metallo-hydrolase [Burkholderiales bacterium]|nr:M20/M25/M40 family metallo-hydrolase [Phycisphaerae bacterium]